jgi:serine/threonine protein phosphatase PrpC
MNVPSSKRALSTSEHLYRIFLMLYPKGFRQAYGQEMARTFRDCCREALQRAGVAGLARFWGFILGELVVTACVEHLRALVAKIRHLFSIEQESMMLDNLFRLDVAQRTDIGRKRAANEDCVTTVLPQDQRVMANKGALFVVADGMGGHDRGAEASEMTVNTVSAAYYQDAGNDIAAALARAVKDANTAVYREAQANVGAAKMGSTCIAAVLKGDSVYIANVGDSRAYIVRGGQARQITEDHSWVVEQVRAGILTAEQARTHEKRNVITRCIGMKEQVEVDVFTERVEDGDILVLCTDGLSSLVDEGEMCAIVERHGPEESVTRLIERANEHGGTDNITALVARVALS